MQSMTGFGHAGRSFPEHDISVDIKTVNARYFDFRAKLPRELIPYEVEFQKRVQSCLTRGRIDVFVDVSSRVDDQYELDESVVGSYRTIGTRLATMGVPGELTLSALLQLPGVIVPKKGEVSTDSLVAQVMEVLEEAAVQVRKTRSAEGRELRKELSRQLHLLQSALKQIQEQSAQITDYYREKLQRRIESLMKEPSVDSNRLMQELIFHAERSDVSEEIARLFSHIHRFEEYLEESAGHPVGKDLDFLCQEMNRETNTILSKSPLAKTSELAVTAKGTVEKLREQVQNVE